MSFIKVLYDKWRKEGPADIRYLILWFMVFVYPLIVIPHPFYIIYPGGVAPPNYFYAPRYIILAIVSLIALIILLKDRVEVNHPAFIPLGFFIVVSLISTFLASIPVTAWIGNPFRFTGFSTYFFCAILFILAFHANKTEKLLKHMAVCAVIVSFLAVLQHFSINLVPHEPFRKGYASYGTMANPDFLGTYTAFTLPAAVVFYIRERKLIWLLGAALIHAGLMVSLMWGEWMVIILALAIIALYTFKDPAGRKAFALVVFVLALVTCVLLPTKNGVLIKRASVIPGEAVATVRLEDKAGSHRMYIWKETIKLIPDHWPFGIGPDHLIYANIKLGNKPVDKAHNVYLEIAATMGVFALLSYLAFLSFFLWPWKNETGFILWLMIFVYLVQGLFNIDVVMIMPLFWIVLGLSLRNSN